jgi:toxin YoeB
MGQYRIIIEKGAAEDFRNIYRSGDPASIKKLEKIILELSLNPQVGSGNPEILKFSLSGLWSRKINKKDRLIYQIIEIPERVVIILSALGHYK